ncbi:MAG: hypothetical protein ACYC6Y_27230 [Thermoguttaceae bacterium]
MDTRTAPNSSRPTGSQARIVGTLAAQTVCLVVLLGFWASGASAADDDAYLRYVHPTIREPFADLLDLSVPPELADQPLAALGYVDVTAEPFRADPTGKTDSTAAVQAAVVFARDHQMACFFPTGTYVLSDTLSCTQQLYRRANGRVFGGNRFPNMLVGSRAGSQRPRLVLAPRAAGFDDPAHPKVSVDTAAETGTTSVTAVPGCWWTAPRDLSVFISSACSR